MAQAATRRGLGQPAFVLVGTPDRAFSRAAEPRQILDNRASRQRRPWG
jgi:hypothetical protein